MTQPVFTRIQVKELDGLIAELTKDSPDLAYVERAMKILGLDFSSDPLQRLNTVLMALHPLANEKEVEL